MLHAVIDSKSRVNVEVDGLIGILRIEVKHDTDNLVSELVVNFGTEEDNALTVETIVDIDPVSSLGSGYAVSYLWDSDGHHFDGIGVFVSSDGGALCKGSDGFGHGSHNAIAAWYE